jgi:glycosyltransferase involved in cell wall biosynthesis
VARLQPDVVHTWNSVPGMFGSLAADWTRRQRGRLRFGRWRQGLGVRHAADEPSIGPRLVIGQYRIERWPPTWDAWVERRFARHASRYLSNSSIVREWCVRRGLRDQRFTVIPPGVPPAPPSGVSREDLLRELRLPADARLIGVVGRLIPEKRVRDLIWAADLLRVLHDNLRLLIIGDGPLRLQLEQYARAASDLEHIRFLGRRKDVARIMPHCDVFWNGSDNRSISIAILEAMAAGVPVVAADTPVNRQLVVEGETGYLIPVGHRAGRAARARHTDRIFTDAALAARLGAAARERVAEHFDAQKCLQGHMSMYGSLTK